MLHPLKIVSSANPFGGNCIRESKPFDVIRGAQPFGSATSRKRAQPQNSSTLYHPPAHSIKANSCYALAVLHAPLAWTMSPSWTEALNERRIQFRGARR